MPPFTWLDKSEDWFEKHSVLPLIQAATGSIQVFEVKGRPMPQERPRVCVKGGKAWGYTPSSSKTFKEKVYWSVVGARPIKWEPPYTVILKFICDPELEPHYKYPMSTKHGDLDNLAKSVLDALFGKNKIFSDDRFIKDLVLYKRLPEINEEPCVKIILIK